MSNVKPGDIARLIYDPTFPENIGAQLYVKGLAKELRERERWATPDGTPIDDIIWLCEALQPIKGFRHANPMFGCVTVGPGQAFITRDKYLRRVDPSTEDETDETFTPKEAAHALP